MEPRLYLILYDITSPRRLRRVYRALLRRGAWTQLSCFLCRLDMQTQAEMESELRALIDVAVDKLLIIDLGPGTTAGARFNALAGTVDLDGPRVRII